MKSIPESAGRLEQSRRELEDALAEIQTAVPLAALQERRRASWVVPVVAAAVGLVLALAIKRRR